jgi:hypothetical protein
MSTLSIAEAIGIVRDVTGQKPRSIGVTLFVDGIVSGEERGEIRDALSPQAIKTDERRNVTQVDL